MLDNQYPTHSKMFIINAAIDYVDECYTFNVSTKGNQSPGALCGYVQEMKRNQKSVYTWKVLDSSYHHHHHHHYSSIQSFIHSFNHSFQLITAIAMKVGLNLSNLCIDDMKHWHK